MNKEGKKIRSSLCDRLAIGKANVCQSFYMSSLAALASASHPIHMAARGFLLECDSADRSSTRSGTQSPCHRRDLFHNVGFFANLLTFLRGKTLMDVALLYWERTKGSGMDPAAPREDAGMRRSATMRRYLRDEERSIATEGSGRPATAFRTEHRASMGNLLRRKPVSTP